MSERLKFWLILLSPILALLAIVAYMALAPVKTARPVVMYPATTPVDLDMQEQVQKLLAKGADERNVYNYAITNVAGSVVSVAGLPDMQGGTWHLEDSIWLGTVDLRNTISPVQRANMAPERFGLVDYGGGSGAILPWASGTNATYGVRGVHSCGYSMTGYYAVDFLPANNQVYASEAGDVSYICRDNTQVSMRVGDHMYAHLVDTGQQVGTHFEQGQALGALVTGTFDDTCGWADQQTFHVHFCFQPNATAGSWTADGYVLNIGNQSWVKNGSTIEPGGVLTATWENAGDIPGGGAADNFNLWDYLVNGVVTIGRWALTTFFLPPGTAESAVFIQINWVQFFASGVGTVIILVGAALSTFNWWVPGIALGIYMVLFSIQLVVSIYSFVAGLIKKIPFL